LFAEWKKNAAEAACDAGLEKIRLRMATPGQAKRETVMSRAKGNLKMIWGLQLLPMAAMVLISWFIEEGDDRRVLRSIAAGMGFSLLLQMLLFMLRPQWFGDKLKGNQSNGGESPKRS
jgi:hypothetical protein